MKLHSRTQMRLLTSRPISVDKWRAFLVLNKTGDYLLPAQPSKFANRTWPLWEFPWHIDILIFLQRAEHEEFILCFQSLILLSKLKPYLQSSTESLLSLTPVNSLTRLVCLTTVYRVTSIHKHQSLHSVPMFSPPIMKADLWQALAAPWGLPSGVLKWFWPCGTCNGHETWGNQSIIANLLS